MARYLGRSTEMEKNLMTNRDWALLLFMGLIFGTAFFFIEVALQDLGVLNLVWARVTLAGLVMVVWVHLRGEHLPTSIRIWGLFALMGFFNNALPFSLITTAQVELTGGLTAIFMGATPLFTILLAHFFTQDEKMSWRKMMGVLVGGSGVVFLIGPGVLAELDPTSVAQLIAIAGTACYAVAGIIGKQLKDISSFVAAAGMLIAASVMMLPVVLIFDSPFAAQWTYSTLWALIGLSFISTAGAYIIYFTLLRNVGATNMLLVTLLAPVSAIGLGLLFLGEAITTQMVLGALTIGLGLVIIDGRALKWAKGRLRQAA